MKRFLATVALLSTTGTLAAACGSSTDDQAICARISACLGAESGRLGLTCETISAFEDVDSSLLGSTEKLEAAMLDCVKSTTECAAVKECLKPSGADQAAACKGKNGPVCSGDVAVECANGSPVLAEDCGAAGLHCFSGASQAVCGTDACDPSSAKDSCDGDFIVHCNEGALQRENCKLKIEVTCSSDGMGETCSTHAGDTCAMVSGEAKCVGSGDACDDSTFAAKCDGTTVITCTGGKTARVDCAALDSHLTCKDHGGGQVECTGAGTECDDKTPETCKDGVISYCFWGKKTTLDCKSYGYSGCTSLDGGAGCTP